MPISKNFQNLRILTLTIFFCFTSVAAWAMSEDEYAAIAAESFRSTHEAGPDAAAVSKASEDFLKKYPEVVIEEYLQMARGIMQDKELAKRVSEKIVARLNQMGYRVRLDVEGDLNSIVVEK